MTYDANVEAWFKVDCLKVLSDVAVCEDTPTGFNVRDNVVTFNNSATDYGSRRRVASCTATNWVEHRRHRCWQPGANHAHKPPNRRKQMQTRVISLKPSTCSWQPRHASPPFGG